MNEGMHRDHGRQSLSKDQRPKTCGCLLYRPSGAPSHTTKSAFLPPNASRTSGTVDGRVISVWRIVIFDSGACLDMSEGLYHHSLAYHRLKVQRYHLPSLFPWSTRRQHMPRKGPASPGSGDHHCWAASHDAHFSFCSSTWLQLPGAAHRSTAVLTPVKRSNSSSRWSSLYADLAR